MGERDTGPGGSVRRPGPGGISFWGLPVQLPYQAGWKVKMIEGEAENRKLTYPMDWTICQLILKEREEC